MRPLLILAATCSAAVLLAQNPVIGPWVDPVKDEPSGTHYKTFHSAIIDAEVSYLVWLPPDYEASPGKRYPVIYWLHGGGGTQRNGAFFVQIYEAAMKRGVAPPAIVMLLNGLRESNWVDSKDGKTPMEAVIVKDLIPHVDQTYRTIARRQARAIEGSSMGGWGALRLGFRHNELFGAVSGLQPAVVSEKDQPMKLPKRVFETVYGADLDYFRLQTAWTVAEQNAVVVRKNTLVRIAVGDQDDWTYEHLKPYHELLTRLEIPHEYIVVPGIKHDPVGVYRMMGDKGFEFFAKAFAKSK